MQETHSILLNRITPSGSKEWVCPTCGRRILFTGPPNKKMVVLEVGDDTALHTGAALSQGGVFTGVGGMDVGVSEQSLTDEDYERLVPFEEWAKLNLGYDDDQPVDV